VVEQTELKYLVNELDAGGKMGVNSYL